MPITTYAPEHNSTRQLANWKFVAHKKSEGQKTGDMDSRKDIM